MTNKNIWQYVLGILCVTVPVLLVFWPVLRTQIVTAGDAPHFWQEELAALATEPMAWTERGTALGGNNLIVWISPILVLIGLFSELLHFQSDLLIALFFYVPAILLSLIGPFFLARYLKFSQLVGMFASLIYTLNTYFILLIDGGQVGVALAYGVFPLAVLFLKRYVDEKRVPPFVFALVAVTYCGIADPRIAVVAFLTVGLLIASEAILETSIQKISGLFYLSGLGIVWMGINLYWILPLLRNAGGNIINADTEAGLSWLHSLFLYSPHWPSNVFGKLEAPKLYFAVIPMISIIGLVLNRKNKVLVAIFSLIVVFSFLAKGTAFPLSQVYKALLSASFGFAFRDSTKFFAPVILFMGLAFGNAIVELSLKLPRIKIVIYSLAYACLLLLIYPAIRGEMNFVLSHAKAGQNNQVFIDAIRNDDSYFRVAWFPEKISLAPESQKHPSLDARELINFYPLANMNSGEDPFNYLNNKYFYKWLEVLGIKYLAFSGSLRGGETVQDKMDWSKLLATVDSNKSLTRIDDISNFPVYETSEQFPEIFAVKKMNLIVGGFKNAGDYNLSPALYFEDGKLDPRLLEGKKPESGTIIYSGKSNKLDLTMSFLQKYFKSGSEARVNGWATYGAGEYLKYKYQLLIRGVNFTDLDYSKGIAFSTILDEKLEFDFQTISNVSYVFAERVWSKDEKRLIWKIHEPEMSTNGKVVKSIINESGFSIFNVSALVPEEDYIAAEKLAGVFEQHFGVTPERSIETDSMFEWKEIEFERFGTSTIRITPLIGYNWIILPKNYNPKWVLGRGDVERFQSLPVYSSLNSFYVEDNWSKLTIDYVGQKNLRWGVYYSILAGLSVSIFVLWRWPSKED